jgi:hypothetical protein
MKWNSQRVKKRKARQKTQLVSSKQKRKLHTKGVISGEGKHCEVDGDDYEDGVGPNLESSNNGDVHH